MTLKILGGEFKGRLLKAPKGTQTRPTMSMLRKAVFDILQFKVQDALFLDLFSGSGMMGIEALSRGARQAIFIDSHRGAIDTLKANLSLLKVEARARVIQSDVFKALLKLHEANTVCDIIYADPPYGNLKAYTELLEFLDTTPLMPPHGILFLESPTLSPLKSLPFALKHLAPFPIRKYGDSELHIFQMNTCS
jgi:16S rRNA (guanine(966)-N(2))-methyltransferase RsmD